jgi:type IV pilus assembly protein PilQ
MTAFKGLRLLVSLALAAVLVEMPGSAAETPAATSGRLTTISSRAHATGATIVIEADEPVPYSTTRPDPLTVLVDFRDVSAEGFPTPVIPSGPSPIADVSVEVAEVLGARVSRVRVSLTHPVAHHVYSERNSVFVEFDQAGEPADRLVVPGGGGSGATLDALQALNQNRVGSADVLAALNGSRTTARPISMDVATAAAAAQATQAGSQPLPQDSGMSARPPRVYTGHPVSLDFQGADLRAVLRTFSEISGLNVVIDPAVTGSVDVALREVPWDQALDQILKANKLGFIVDGTIVRIAPNSVLEEEEEQRRTLIEKQELAGELHVVTRTLSYARATELRDLLTRSALSQRGTVEVDARTNTLIITDLQDRLVTASNLLDTLDTPQPQVEIEARIIQTTRDYARELGINWGFNGLVDPALGNTSGVAFPNSGTATGAVNMPASSPSSNVGITLGSVNGAFNLDVALTALEANGNGRLLSTPRVTTQNNVPAEITQGTQIPIQTVSNNTVTVSFKDAALSLLVTPQITAANTVIMRVELENAKPDFSRSVNGIPPIDTQRASTTVLVNDGQTTVIGGIYTTNEDYQERRTPGLSRLPLLSWLFKSERVDEISTELLIFITPKIIG